MDKKHNPRASWSSYSGSNFRQGNYRVLTNEEKLLLDLSHLCRNATSITDILNKLFVSESKVIANDEKLLESLSQLSAGIKRLSEDVNDFCEYEDKIHTTTSRVSVQSRTIDAGKMTKILKGLLANGSCILRTLDRFNSMTALSKTSQKKLDELKVIFSNYSINNAGTAKNKILQKNNHHLTNTANDFCSVENLQKKTGELKIIFSESSENQRPHFTNITSYDKSKNYKPALTEKPSFKKQPCNNDEAAHCSKYNRAMTFNHHIAPGPTNSKMSELRDNSVKIDQCRPINLTKTVTSSINYKNSKRHTYELSRDEVNPIPSQPLNLSVYCYNSECNSLSGVHLAKEQSRPEDLSKSYSNDAYKKRIDKRMRDPRKSLSYHNSDESLSLEHKRIYKD